MAQLLWFIIGWSLPNLSLSRKVQSQCNLKYKQAPHGIQTLPIKWYTWYTNIANGIHCQWYTNIANVYKHCQWYTNIANGIQTLVYNGIQMFVYNGIQTLPMVYKHCQLNVSLFWCLTWNLQTWVSSGKESKSIGQMKVMWVAWLKYNKNNKYSIKRWDSILKDILAANNA